MRYYIAIEGVQQGPFEVNELAIRGLRPDTLVWTEGWDQWRRADSVPQLQHLFAAAGSPGAAATMPPPAAAGGSWSPPPPPPGVDYQPVPAQYAASSNRIAAGVCGILLGSLGIHKFILGLNGAGIAMLLITVLTCGIGGIVMSIIGLIEGIIYLTKSEQEFYRDYVIGRKQWF